MQRKLPLYPYGYRSEGNPLVPVLLGLGINIESRAGKYAGNKGQPMRARPSIPFGPMQFTHGQHLDSVGPYLLQALQLPLEPPKCMVRAAPEDTNMAA